MYKIEIEFQNGRFEILLNGKLAGTAGNYLEADAVAARVEREQESVVAMADDINHAPPRTYEH